MYGDLYTVRYACVGSCADCLEHMEVSLDPDSQKLPIDLMVLEVADVLSTPSFGSTLASVIAPPFSCSLNLKGYRKMEQEHKCRKWIGEDWVWKGWGW